MESIYFNSLLSNIERFEYFKISTVECTDNINISCSLSDNIHQNYQLHLTTNDIIHSFIQSVSL